MAYDFVSGRNEHTPWVLEPVDCVNEGAFTGRAMQNPFSPFPQDFFGELSGFNYIHGSPALMEPYGCGYLAPGESGPIEYIDIMGGIPEDNFAFLFSCFESGAGAGERNESRILLNSDNNNRGLSLGLNCNKNLYIEYRSPLHGVIVFDQPEPLNCGMNFIFLRKHFGNFTFGFFDGADSSLRSVSRSYNVLGGYSHCSGFNIGGRAVYPPRDHWSYGAHFVGFFDQFYCITGYNIDDGTIIQLFSGFYSAPRAGLLSGIVQSCVDVSTLSESGVILATGVTGHETRTEYLTGYIPSGCRDPDALYQLGNYETGYYDEYVETQIDGDGNPFQVYRISPLTGFIYTTGITGVCDALAEVITEKYTNIDLTGLISGSVYGPVINNVCYPNSAYYPDTLYVDSNYLLGCPEVPIVEQIYKEKIKLIDTDSNMAWLSDYWVSIKDPTPTPTPTST